MKKTLTITFVLSLLVNSISASDAQDATALHFSTANDRLIYATDLIKNDINVEQGLQLMKVSAEQNHAPSQFRYATYILKQLTTTEENLIEAYAWTSVILSGGNLPRYKTLTSNAATEAITKLEEIFGRDAVIRAKERAETYCKRYNSTN